MAIRRDIDENYRNIGFKNRPTFNELSHQAKSHQKSKDQLLLPKDSEQYKGYLEPLCDHIGHSIALVDLFTGDYKFLNNESDKLLQKKIHKSFLRKIEKSKALLRQEALFENLAKLKFIDGVRGVVQKAIFSILKVLDWIKVEEFKEILPHGTRINFSTLSKDTICSDSLLSWKSIKTNLNLNSVSNLNQNDHYSLIN